MAVFGVLVAGAATALSMVTGIGDLAPSTQFECASANGGKIDPCPAEVRVKAKAVLTNEGKNPAKACLVVWMEEPKRFGIMPDCGKEFTDLRDLPPQG